MDDGAPWGKGSSCGNRRQLAHYGFAITWLQRFRLPLLAWCLPRGGAFHVCAAKARRSRGHGHKHGEDAQESSGSTQHLVGRPATTPHFQRPHTHPVTRHGPLFGLRPLGLSPSGAIPLPSHQLSSPRNTRPPFGDTTRCRAGHLSRPSARLREKHRFPCQQPLPRPMENKNHIYLWT